MRTSGEQVTLITGVGRGIGLEIGRQLLGSGDTVIACPRQAATAEVIRLAETAGPDENGAFLGPGGERIPW